MDEYFNENPKDPVKAVSIVSGLIGLSLKKHVDEQGKFQFDFLYRYGSFAQAIWFLVRDISNGRALSPKTIEDIRRIALDKYPELVKEVTLRMQGSGNITVVASDVKPFVRVNYVAYRRSLDGRGSSNTLMGYDIFRIKYNPKKPPYRGPGKHR